VGRMRRRRAGPGRGVAGSAGGSVQTQLSGLTFMPSFMPPPLRSVNDTGISPAVLQELLLKLMYFGSGGGTAVELARRAKLPFLGVTDVLLDTLRRQSLVEVRGGASTLATAYEYALTERGRARAQELAERSRY